MIPFCVREFVICGGKISHLRILAWNFDHCKVSSSCVVLRGSCMWASFLILTCEFFCFAGWFCQDSPLIICFRHRSWGWKQFVLVIFLLRLLKVKILIYMWFWTIYHIQKLNSFTPSFLTSGLSDYVNKTPLGLFKFALLRSPHSQISQNLYFFSSIWIFHSRVGYWCYCVFSMADMETEERNQRACKSSEPEIFLQWGNRKRLRCTRAKDPRISARLNDGFRRKLTSPLDPSVTNASEKENNNLQLNRLRRWEQWRDLLILLVWSLVNLGRGNEPVKEAKFMFFVCWQPRKR